MVNAWFSSVGCLKIPPKGISVQIKGFYSAPLLILQGIFLFLTVFSWSFVQITGQIQVILCTKTLRALILWLFNFPLIESL